MPRQFYPWLRVRPFGWGHYIRLAQKAQAAEAQGWRYDGGMGGGKGVARWENVGRENLDCWHQEMKAKYEELLPKHFQGGVGKQALASGWTDEKLEKALKALRREMPDSRIAMEGLPQSIKDALGANADSLFFSADSLAKQLYHHPEITSAEYKGVMAKIKDDGAEIYRSRKKHHVALIVNRGRRYAVILKTTKDRLETYITSLYRIKQDALAQLCKYGRIK